MSAINTYSYTMIDVPGVVATNNFVNILNPTTSNRVIAFTNFIVSAYALTTSQTGASLGVYKTTGVSGGTVDSSNIARFNTALSTSVAEIRKNNPTLTRNKLVLYCPPPISTGTGSTTEPRELISPVSVTNTILLYPGEGLCATTLSGNVNQLWNINFAWVEFF